MDKKSLLGFVLILAVTFLWMLNSRPSQEEIARQKEIRDSTIAAQAQAEIAITDDPTVTDIISNNQESTEKLIEPVLSDSAKKAENQGKYGSLSVSIARPDAKPIVIQNDKIKLEINPNGGLIQYAEVLDYKTFDSLPVILTDRNDLMNLSFLQKDGDKNNKKLSEFYFEPSSQGFKVDGENSDVLTMTLKNANGGAFEIDYRLKGGSYNVEVEMRSRNMDNTMSSAQPLIFNWEVEGKGREKSISTELTFTQLGYKFKNDDKDDISGDDVQDVDRKLEWAAFKQYFFSSFVYSESGFKSDYGDLITEKLNEEEGKTFNFKASNLGIPINNYGNGTTNLEFYFGPNHLQTLDDFDRQYEEVIDYGWGIFGTMNKWVVIPIFNWLRGLGIGSYGIIILILTVIIKLALSPLTYKNYLSSAKQKVLKPEVEEINKKYKDGDAMKKQQAMMALYKKTGVNPMAGCIPMIIQLPILYAMFRFFPSSIELRQQSFLWADDLSAYDSIFEWSQQIPVISSIYGNHVSLFTLLMAASTLLYTRMNSSQMTMPSQPGMPNMKMIMYIFPFMMLFFFNKFASGLSYYYLLANLFSMGQMYVIKNYVIDEDKIRAQIASNKKKPAKAKSKFQKRLEEMAKERGMQMPKK